MTLPSCFDRLGMRAFMGLTLSLSKGEVVKPPTTEFPVASRGKNARLTFGIKV